MLEALKRVRNIKPVIWFLLFAVTVFSLINGRYFTASNLDNLLQQSAALTVLAFGQTLIILTQGTDLSMGAQVSFCTIAFVLLAMQGVPFWLCAILVTLCTILIGAVNSLVISILHVPVFISTFGMQYIMKSISLILCDGNSIYYSSDLFYRVSSGSFLGIPFVTWIAVAAFLITWVMLNRTRLGANIVALGGNIEALKVSGINATIVRMKTWMFAGFLTGIAGLLVLCRVESGQPAVGDGMEFNAIAAVLLGGTSMREGKGGVFGTIFGVWLIYALRNGLNLSGLSSLYHNAILGTVILLAIVVDALIGRAGKREG